jgi:hypothetical protein
MLLSMPSSARIAVLFGLLSVIDAYQYSNLSTTTLSSSICAPTTLWATETCIETVSVCSSNCVTTETCYITVDNDRWTTVTDKYVAPSGCSIGLEHYEANRCGLALQPQPQFWYLRRLLPISLILCVFWVLFGMN